MEQLSTDYCLENRAGMVRIKRAMADKSNYQYVVFTDLDGTLLDHFTYSWKSARPALQAMRRHRTPLVLVSSKTAAEIRPLLKELGLREPFVAENGGVMYVPHRYFSFPLPGTERAPGGWQRLIKGVPRRKLIKALAHAARLAGASVRGFSQMSTGEVAAMTGLGMREARRARQREVDEPFVVKDGNEQALRRLNRQLRNQGLQITRGSRFHHLLGRNDKGAAVGHLIRLYRKLHGPRVRTVALGDSPNDIAMLKVVDTPVLVARPSGRYDGETLKQVPAASKAGGIGPVGWNRAVLAILRANLSSKKSSAK